ncbi:MAG TPA: hypothetical protein PK867_23115 [Pirellulales bacterium]|nr:hypothetical protein [Pirellulales bacterium]
MNDRSFLQVQAIQLRQLLGVAGDDPVLVPQLRQRPEDVEDKLRKLGAAIERPFPEAVASLPRVALFLGGGGVQGSEGIRPGLAGEALIQYEKMFVEQALQDERDAAKQLGRQRRPRGTPVPSLLFTGTPRGSFGLEFIPEPTEDGSLLELHSGSLRHVAEALVAICSDDRRPDDAARSIPPRVLWPMKRFFSILAQYGAELRIAFSDAPSQSIDVETVKGAAELLDRELIEEIITARGVFRGLTRESLVFDLLADDGTLVTGAVSTDLDEDDLDRIASLTNDRCIASLQKTTLRQVVGGVRETYVLLDAEPEH